MCNENIIFRVTIVLLLGQFKTTRRRPQKHEVEKVLVRALNSTLLSTKFQAIMFANLGFPPFLLHDLFEGEVEYDAFQLINYLCKTLKWLTYCERNSALSNLRYKSSDNLDKPLQLILKVKRFQVMRYKIGH